MKKNRFNLLPFFKKAPQPTILPVGLPTQEKPREYFRLQLPSPLIATLHIININEKPVQMKHTEVLIEDIGPGGLRFLSELEFPLIHEITLLFETIILGEKIEVKGKIRWKKEKDGLFSYGIELNIEEFIRKELAQQLNRFMLSLKNEGIYPKSHFYKEEPAQFFEFRQRKI